jgi:hypothetical protein
MDLFDGVPDSTSPICKPAADYADPMPMPAAGVACFACRCGARDEVVELAPRTVACWQKDCKGQMHRWEPRFPPPPGNARQLTADERSRM